MAEENKEVVEETTEQPIEEVVNEKTTQPRDEDGKFISKFDSYEDPSVTKVDLDKLPTQDEKTEKAETPQEDVKAETAETNEEQPIIEEVVEEVIENKTVEEVE